MIQQPGEPPIGVFHLHQGRGLRLAAGPAEIDEQLLRGTPCRIFAEVLTDQCQRQIDAGGDSCRAADPAVLDEDAVGIEANRWKPLREFRCATPVSRRPLAFEQSCRGRDVCSGADACDSARAFSASTRESRGRRAFGRGSRSLPTRRDQGIDWGHATKRSGLQAHAGGATDQSRPGGDDAQRMRTRPVALRNLEGGDGPGDVQYLKPGEDEERDAALHGMK